MIRFVVTVAAAVLITAVFGTDIAPAVKVQLQKAATAVVEYFNQHTETKDVKITIGVPQKKDK